MSVPMLIAALMAASSGGKGRILTLDNHTVSATTNGSYRLLGTGEAQRSIDLGAYSTYTDEWSSLAPGEADADFDWKWVSLGDDPNTKPTASSGVWTSFTTEDPTFSSVTGAGLRTDSFEIHVGLAGAATTLVSATITISLAGSG